MKASINKHTHLTSNDRSIIQQKLVERESFKSIARELGKDSTTIFKEVKNHIQFRKTGCYGKPYNDCLNRMGCSAQHLCGNRQCRRYYCFCNSHSCASLCPGYQVVICPRLAKPPYVCNGCEKRKSCTLEKRIYSAGHAHKEYEEIRSEARRVVRMGKRKRKKDTFKVDKKCRINRNYQDFQQFMSEHPGLPIVEMDSVEGTKGGKVLLTLHFVVPQLMLAFIREANTSQSVIDIFNKLYQELQPEVFRKLFPVLLGDNGSEFSHPTAIENDLQGHQRARVFYCDPQASYQKGAAENNHTFIRRIIPKSTSLDSFTQKDISLMMNHINSYSRQNLGDKTPYAVFAALYGDEILRRMGADLIPNDKVTLHPSLLKK